MKLQHLLCRELVYRRWNFLLAVLSVAVAAGCLVWQFTLLRLHDAATETLVAEKEGQTTSRMTQLERDIATKLTVAETATKKRLAQLEDDFRKLMLNLGFNLLILPEQQNLAELYAEGQGTATMPEAYAEKLAKSNVMSINHLLPTVQQMVKWPEQNRRVLVVGTRGEMPLLKVKQKKPLLDLVKKDEVVVGYDLHQALKLQKGDKITFRGQEFTVVKLHPERGNRDDITLWINLRQAQEMLGLTGRLHAILALECNCAADRLEKIRGEVHSILPDTQVVERYSEALTRAESRNRAAREAQEALAEEQRKATSTKTRVAASAQHELAAIKLTRAELRQQRQDFAGVVLPIVLVACIVWLGAVTLSNVREREIEVGILRAIGVPRGQILALLLGRALLVGLLGAGVGIAVALVSLSVTNFEQPLSLDLVPLPLLVGVLLGAPLLSVVVAWLTATLAARQDPAVILQEA